MCEMCTRREASHTAEVATLNTATFEADKRQAGLCCVCFRNVQSFRPSADREVCRC